MAARAWLAVAAAAVAGCWSEAPRLSIDIATADLSIFVRADGRPDRTTVTAHLSGPLAKGGAVELTEGDVLVARHGGEEAGFGLAGDEYAVHLAPGAVGWSVQLLRAPPHEDAGFAVPMPPATALEAAPSASRGEPLVVQWEPAMGPHTTTLAVTGSCLTDARRTLTVDTGTYAFQPADLASSSGEACAATVTLTREANVTLSAPPLRNAQAIVRQVAITTLESSP